MRTRFTILALISLLMLSLSACDQYSGYPNSRDGYYDPYSGGYDNDYNRRREWDRTRRDRREIERERDRIEEERERLDRERRENEERRRNHGSYSPPPPARVERCPSGFSPSEQKCSPEERRRGCQDMRLPGGLGCVRR